MSVLKVAAIVLAAGEGRRLGGAKALAMLQGETFLARVVRLLARAGIEDQIVVTGADAERVEEESAHLGVRCVRNDGWRGGMLGSILVGLAEAEERGARGVLVHPVDHPLVRSETVRDVVRALARGAMIVVPSSGGRRGHPAGFASPVWPDLRAAEPEIGARRVLAMRARDVVHIPSSPECLLGINTPADLAAVDGTTSDLER